MNNDLKKRALGLILLFGLVSLFGDIVYEGARSVNGPYLKLLAVNAVTLGLISGIGEFLGYGLRLLSGYISDKTRSYWLLTLAGYGLLVSVPLLSLAGIWQVAALFIIVERIGKAIRSPARDTILSQASSQVGTGFGFGLHEATDQIGAVAGPLIFTVFFVSTRKTDLGIADYQKGYGFLWIPFLLVMVCLFIAYRRVPQPEALESAPKIPGLVSEKLSKEFWIYTIFTFVTTLGFCNFILIAFHFKSANILSDANIPLYYAIAMGVDAVAALSIGKFYDMLKGGSKNHHAGLNTLLAIPLTSLFIPLFAFSENRLFVIIGVICWGIAMGTHETIMRSAIADITPLKKRGTGYGIFNTTYGLAIFLGSVLLGFLYDRSIFFVVTAVIVIECLALAVFLYMRKAYLQ
ncbi:MAG: MFS transporter [Candidatus Omnitrophica bacterium]|nr:MFS transporter [Candidatus Omnitrophota bacterium]MDD5553361.1 MFS transporter [Candidatus Omnitrophota bacterium]